jgi:hypothetical protein
MHAGRKYLSLVLGFGVCIGVAIIAAFLILGIAAQVGIGFAPLTGPTQQIVAVPSSTPTEFPVTPSAAPTFTPIPTLTTDTNIPAGFELASTATPDPIASIISARGLIFTGALSNTEQVSIYRASLRYVRANPADSKREAKEINGVGYGDPNNICGPLAIAILLDAGVVPPTVTPHDFWLLNPAAVPDQRILARAFPADKFVHTQISTPLNKVDWLASPLETGDFLFIWHGSWGNFDHMLVVNRVDADLRAYAVTNYGTPDGFIIAETLLYDPHDPNAGIFHTWTKARDQILGSTGFGGYEIWRSRAH